MCLGVTSWGRAWCWHLMGRDATKYPSINRVAPSPTQTKNYSSINVGDKMLKVWTRLIATAMKMGSCLYICWGKENEDSLVCLDQTEQAFRCRTIGIKMTVVFRMEVWADYLSGGVKYRRWISKTDHLILLTNKEKPKSLLSCNLFCTLLW